MPPGSALRRWSVPLEFSVEVVTPAAEQALFGAMLVADAERALELKDKQLQELESRNAAELRRSYHAIDAVLDLRQQARFRVMEQQLERRNLER